METLINCIHPFFDQNKWQLLKKGENTAFYKYKTKYDEFIINFLPKTNEIEITIPLNEVSYKNKFYNVDTAINYLKMHLNYYKEGNA